ATGCWSSLVASEFHVECLDQMNDSLGDRDDQLSADDIDGILQQLLAPINSLLKCLRADLDGVLADRQRLVLRLAELVDQAVRPSPQYARIFADAAAAGASCRHHDGCCGAGWGAIRIVEPNVWLLPSRPVPCEASSIATTWVDEVELQSARLGLQLPDLDGRSMNAEAVVQEIA